VIVSASSKRAPSFEELYEQIERLPQRLTGEILVAGVLLTTSPLGASQDHALANVTRALESLDRRFGGKGWWLRRRFEVRLPGDRLVVPHLAGWREDRYPELPDDNPLRIVPDWCAEVLSPTTASDDRTLKLPLFAQTGVGHVWLVDPELRLVEVYESIDRRPTLVAVSRDADVVSLPPFGIELSLQRWWRAPAERAASAAP
jgi:Uma2 family endonuclease